MYYVGDLWLFSLKKNIENYILVVEPSSEQNAAHLTEL